MNEIQPRYEFRAFSQNFGIVVEKMRRLSRCEQIRESAEIYIMSAGNNENNTKIRDDKMDIKVLVGRDRGLEQWSPRMKGTFPMSASVIAEDVFPAFGVSPPAFDRDRWSLPQFLDELIRPDSRLVAANVFKRRFGFTVNDCITEHAEILVNGAALQTVAVEAVDVEAILAARRMLALDEYENVNYLIAIKRVIGMEPMPAN
jgi:hypothetical protein